MMAEWFILRDVFDSKNNFLGSCITIGSNNSKYDYELYLEGMESNELIKVPDMSNLAVDKRILQGSEDVYLVLRKNLKGYTETIQKVRLNKARFTLVDSNFLKIYKDRELNNKLQKLLTKENIYDLVIALSQNKESVRKHGGMFAYNNILAILKGLTTLEVQI